MGVFPRILFQMSPLNSDFLGRPIFQGHINPAIIADRFIKLRNLIGLGIVRVEIVLAVKVHLLVNAHIQGQSSLDTCIHNPLIENRQDTWEGPVNDIGAGILVLSKMGSRWGENFGVGVELHMDFNPDNCFKVHYFSPPKMTGCCLW